MSNFKRKLFVICMASLLLSSMNVHAFMKLSWWNSDSSSSQTTQQPHDHYGHYVAASFFAGCAFTGAISYWLATRKSENNESPTPPTAHEVRVAVNNYSTRLTGENEELRSHIQSKDATIERLNAFIIKQNVRIKSTEERLGRMAQDHAILQADALQLNAKNLDLCIRLTLLSHEYAGKFAKQQETIKKLTSAHAQAQQQISLLKEENTCLQDTVRKLIAVRA